MTHHQFGTIVGDEQIGGTFNLVGSVLAEEHTTVAVQKNKVIPAGLIALELAGQVVGQSDETVQVVWVMSAMSAGQQARALWDACERLSEEEQRDFKAGWDHPDE